MSKKLMTWEEMWEKLKALDPNTKVTFEMAEKVCKLYNSVENKIIEDLQYRLEVAEKALELACEELSDSNSISICNYCPYNIEDECVNECPQSTKLLENYFKVEAEKEVKGE